MKVRELITLLEKQNPEKKVVIADEEYGPTHIDGISLEMTGVPERWASKVVFLNTGLRAGDI